MNADPQQFTQYFNDIFQISTSIFKTWLFLVTEFFFFYSAALNVHLLVIFTTPGM